MGTTLKFLQCSLNPFYFLSRPCHPLLYSSSQNAIQIMLTSEIHGFATPTCCKLFQLCIYLFIFPGFKAPRRGNPSLERNCIYHLLPAAWYLMTGSFSVILMPFLWCELL